MLSAIAIQSRQNKVSDVRIYQLTSRVPCRIDNGWRLGISKGLERDVSIRERGPVLELPVS